MSGDAIGAGDISAMTEATGRSAATGSPEGAVGADDVAEVLGTSGGDAGFGLGGDVDDDAMLRRLHSLAALTTSLLDDDGDGVGNAGDGGAPGTAQGLSP